MCGGIGINYSWSPLFFIFWYIPLVFTKSMSDREQEQQSGGKGKRIFVMIGVAAAFVAVAVMYMTYAAAKYTNEDGTTYVAGIVTDIAGSKDGKISFLGKVATRDECAAKCTALGADKCKAYTWHSTDPAINSAYQKSCHGMVDVPARTKQVGMFSGYIK